MLVKNWMSKDVITVNVDDSMQHAINMMKENSIRMLPVLMEGKLVGVLTDRDLKRASPSDATTLDVHELLYLISKIKIKEKVGAVETEKEVVATVNRTMGMASVGSAALDNEECYLYQKFLRGLGLVYIEHQARI